MAGAEASLLISLRGISPARAEAFRLNSEKVRIFPIQLWREE
jgi:hypothetical protein